MATEPTSTNPPDDAAMTMPTIEDEKATGIIQCEGEPFAGRRPANARFKELGLSADEWEVAEYGSGFAILKKTAPEPDEDAAQEALPPVAPHVERYFKIRFHNKSNPQDPDEVVLGCNGEVLQMQRNVVIPLPERFIEVARGAVYKHFTQEPGKDRKVDREIHKYPFDTLGECTKADFINYKRSGTKSVRDHAAKVGLALEA